MNKKYDRPLTGEELNAMKDADIDFSDIPELDESFWHQAMVVTPEQRKTQITVRLDPDIIAWFKSQGKGYQTRINAVLRSYYEAHSV